MSYELREYLRFVREGMLQHLIRQARASGKRPPDRVPWFASMLVAAGGTIAFLIKSRRIGACEFTIDRERIHRRSASGTMIVQWTDVVAIDRCSHGYLLHKHGGAFPVPYRCLTAGETAMLDVLVAQREQGLIHSDAAAGRLARSAATR